MKSRKGEHGYFRTQKRIRTVRTVILFAIVFFLFAIGMILNHGDRKNIWSIIAAVVCIPAAMSATGMIVMMLRRTASDDLCGTIRRCAGSRPVLYDLYVTTRDTSLQLDAAVLSPDRILCLTSDDRAVSRSRALEEHIRQNADNIFPGICVEILSDTGMFLKQTEDLSLFSPEQAEAADELSALLMGLSL